MISILIVFINKNLREDVFLKMDTILLSATPIKSYRFLPFENVEMWLALLGPFIPVFYVESVTTDRGGHKHASSKLPRKDVVCVRSFVEFLASIRLASPLNRRTYGNSAEREQVLDPMTLLCFEIALNRTAVIQHARFPNLGLRAFLD